MEVTSWIHQGALQVHLLSFQDLEMDDASQSTLGMLKEFEWAITPLIPISQRLMN